MDVEAPLADRDLEIVLDRQPLLHHLGGVGREQRIAAAAAALRLEHRDVGVHQQRLVVAAVRRADGDAGARADHHAGAADLVGLGKLLEQLLGPGADLRLGGAAAHDGEELVAADAGEQRLRHPAGLLLGAEEGAEAGRDDAQEIVAGLVAEGVVDALEAVEVHEQEDAELVAAEPAEQRRAVDPDLLAVRKPGDRVVEGELADAPEARAQVRQHRLEGDAEAVDLAEAGRPERHLEIALGDGGRRPRQLRQAAGGVAH